MRKKKNTLTFSKNRNRKVCSYTFNILRILVTTIQSDDLLKV